MTIDEDTFARLAEINRQLAIEEELVGLLLTVGKPKLTVRELIPLLPEPQRSRAIELRAQMPKYIQIPFIN